MAGVPRVGRPAVPCLSPGPFGGNNPNGLDGLLPWPAASRRPRWCPAGWRSVLPGHAHDDGSGPGKAANAGSVVSGSDIGLVFRGDYLASFGLDRICEELEAVTALAGEYQDEELLAVALFEDEAGDKLRAAHS